MSKVEKLGKYLKERGAGWIALYGVHLGLHKTIRSLEKLSRGVDRRVVQIEQRRMVTDGATLSSKSHTAEENAQRWNTYDWSQSGEEWTLDVQRFRGLDPQQWKKRLLDEMLRKHLREGLVTLEVGPGAGRWTEVLQPMASRLLVADITETCLSLCKQRFADKRNIEYHLIKGDGLSFLGNASVDQIWSYDVFVHINPHDTENYLRDFHCVLKPGGRAVIHHSGSYVTDESQNSFRSHMDARLFAHLVQKHGMRLIEQNDSLPHFPGDVISVFENPAPALDR